MDKFKVIRLSDKEFVVTKIMSSGDAIRVETEKKPYTTRQSANRRKWQLEAESIVVIIKAQGPGPSYAEIKRVGVSMSDFRDMRNHMLLSPEQEAAYEAAYLAVKNGDISVAESELGKCFDWVKVEQ